MHYTFYPKGVCSTQIDLDVDDNGRVRFPLWRKG